MKNYYIYLLLLFGLSLSSCIEQDVPTAEGTLLDFEVPDTPAEINYLVGAHYVSFNWNTNNLEEVPVIGYYDAMAGDPAAYNQHITWAQQAGIDFFIFTIRSGSDFNSDVAFINNLLSASNSGSQNFAIAYDFSAMDLSPSNRIDVEANLVQQLIDDFINMQSFLDMPNYATSSSGNKIVYIKDADAMFAQDYVGVYNSLRTEVNTQLGHNMYLIGEQLEWTPPLRFEFKMLNCVDASSHRTYARIARQGNQVNQDRFALFEQYVDLALGLAAEETERSGFAYIPQVSPSYNATINNAASTDWVIPREEQWFRTFCDISKRASTNNPENIIIIDSFNNWNFDKQIEPAQSYNTQFLNIIRDEFKVN